MKHLNEIIDWIRSEYQDLHCTLMEVCGTHTHSIRKAGIHRLLPPGVELLSGPGCPVCVTGSGYIEEARLLSKESGVMITTFGDLLKVPGNTGTLADARTEGAMIKVVYAPQDALSLAIKHPDLEVVFLGVGFETTAPVVANVVKQAREKGIRNFSVLTSFKILRPAMDVLLSQPHQLDGLIAPGHLGAVIGSESFRFLPERYQLPTVVTGFTPADLWLGIAALLKQIKQGQAKLENKYPAVVREAGNILAVQLMKEVFRPEDTEWRGMGLVSQSGLGFREPYCDFETRNRFKLKPVTSQEPPGCRCGDVILGRIRPENCSLFGKGCQPEHPVGPCMVSAEGACAAYFYYRELE